jgi:hypothetical protein
VKFIVGEGAPAMDDLRSGNVSIMEVDRGPIEVFREEDSEGGRVGTRDGGCCLILRRPEAPIPCSCSVITGDLMFERMVSRL